MGASSRENNNFGYRAVPYRNSGSGLRIRGPAGSLHRDYSDGLLSPVTQGPSARPDRHAAFCKAETLRCCRGVIRTCQESGDQEADSAEHRMKKVISEVV